MKTSWRIVLKKVSRIALGFFIAPVLPLITAQSIQTKIRAQNAETKSPLSTSLNTPVKRNIGTPQKQGFTILDQRESKNLAYRYFVKKPTRNNRDGSIRIISYGQSRRPFDKKYEVADLSVRINKEQKNVKLDKRDVVEHLSVKINKEQKKVKHKKLDYFKMVVEKLGANDKINISFSVRLKNKSRKVVSFYWTGSFSKFLEIPIFTTIVDRNFREITNPKSQSLEFLIAPQKKELLSREPSLKNTFDARPIFQVISPKNLEKFNVFLSLNWSPSTVNLYRSKNIQRDYKNIKNFKLGDYNKERRLTKLPVTFVKMRDKHNYYIIKVNKNGKLVNPKLGGGLTYELNFQAKSGYSFLTGIKTENGETEVAKPQEKNKQNSEKKVYEKKIYFITKEQDDSKKAGLPLLSVDEDDYDRGPTKPTAALSYDSKFIFDVINFANRGSEYSKKFKIKIEKEDGTCKKAKLKEIKSGRFEVQQLNVGDKFRIYASLTNPFGEDNKDGDAWSNGTTNDIWLTRSITVPNSKRWGRSIPKINSVLTPPTTVKTKDGTIEIDFSVFEENNYSLFLKKRSSQPKFSEIKIKIKEKKFTINNATNGEKFDFSLRLRKPQDIWEDGTKEHIISIDVPTTDVIGLALPKVSIVSSKKPTTTTSSNGMLILEIADYDPAKIDLEFSPKSLIKKYNPLKKEYTISKLKNVQQLEISVKPVTGEYWDFSSDLNVISSSQKIFYEKGPETTYVGLTKFNIWEDKFANIAPRIMTSKDGTLVFQLYDLDDKLISGVELKKIVNNMDYAIKAPRSENAKIILKSDNRFNIENLANGDNVKIEFKLKSGQYWKDGTNESITTIFTAPSTNKSGINQPKDLLATLKVVPRTKDSADGEYELSITNFDENKMDIKLSHGEVQKYDKIKKTFRVKKLSSGQEVRIEIRPKAKYSWFSGNDFTAKFEVVKIIDIPKNPIVVVKNPTKPGGAGSVEIKPYQRVLGAKLQYKTSRNPSAWFEVNPNGQTLIGKNQFKVEFRWKINQDFRLINRQDKASAPPSVTIENPNFVATPNIQIVVSEIPRPKSSGSVLVKTFNNPKGAKLYYELETKKGDWKVVPSDGSGSWSGKDGFKITFKWVLDIAQPGKINYVWDIDNPKPIKANGKVIKNGQITLNDPIDNEPPKWKNKTATSDRTITKVVLKNKAKSIYETNVYQFFGTRILKSEILSWFTAHDNYGTPEADQITDDKGNKVISGAVIFDSNDKKIIFKAIDIVGNESLLIVNLLIKYKEIDFQDIQEAGIKYLKTFSGFGEIATMRTTKGQGQVPLISFTNAAKKIIDMASFKIYARYRVVDSLGSEIVWESHNGDKNTSWSKVDKKALNAYGSRYPRYVSNGQKIQIKFVPHDGYKLLIKNSLDLMAPIKADESSIFEFAVTSLIEEIKDSILEPSYVFSGKDSRGKVALSFDETQKDLENQISFLVQVTRPYSPSKLPQGKASINSEGKPIYGVEVFLPRLGNFNMNDASNWKLMAGVRDTFFNWDEKIEEIRKRWVETNIGLIINDPNDPKISPSLINPNEIKTLSNFYWLRAFPKAKRGWGFKWKGDNVVRANPKFFIKQMVWKTLPSFFGAQVKGLYIRPHIDIDSQSFKLNILPSINNAYSYEGDLRVVPSYVPSLQKGDRFTWRYKLIDPDGTIDKNWSSAPNISKIKRGTKIVIGYQAITSYTLTNEFKTKQRAFIVEDLKRKIDASLVPRPRIIFGGLIGKGEIRKLIENDDTKIPYQREVNKIAQPKNNRQGGTTNNLKWQYRVFDIDPISWTEKELNDVKWSDKLPNSLTTSNYVQIRVAPVNEKRDGVEPQIYSIDPKTNSKFVKVNNLEIDINLLRAITFEILGNRNQNIIEMRGIENNPTAFSAFNELTFEVYNDKRASWQPLETLRNKLSNGMVLSFRAFAKNPTIAKLPDPNNNGILEIEGKKYLQLDSWKDVDIQGLKTIIYFRNLEFNKPTFKAMAQTPWDKYPKAKAKNKVVSGWAEIKNEIVDPQDLKSSFYTTQAGDIVSAKSLIEVQYQHLKFNYKTNAMEAQGWSIIPPTNLWNGDEIQIRLTTKDLRNYELDWAREATFKINNLYEPNLQNLIQSSLLIFSGIDGHGIAIPKTKPLKIYQYGYQVYGKNNDLISDWSFALPIDLSNGQYVKTRIITKGDAIFAPQKNYIESQPQLVEGLVIEKKSLITINLSPLVKIKVTGRINNKATLIFNFSILEKLQEKNYQIIYLVWETDVKDSQKFTKIPKNLANGQNVGIKIINKANGKVYDLKELKSEFKDIKVEGLVDEERHSKTLSKAVWIPTTIILLCLLLGFPIYKIRRKKKLSL